jgi:periodic tryptophan protein 2
MEITDLCFIKEKLIVITSSLDGTVRAFDLFRYRNFKILTSPEPRQFTCVAVDDSGDIVAAGCLDTYEIFVCMFIFLYLLYL